MAEQREKLREAIAEFVNDESARSTKHCAEQQDKGLCESGSACYLCVADAILALPRLSAALDALIDLEAGNLVWLAEDQSWPPLPIEMNHDEALGWFDSRDKALAKGFRRVELAEKGEGCPSESQP